ncbi:hypothetical protein CHLRE_06g306035v5 [Chlamydomonas reinhardtii]|uniref:Uncharacterized protein n=1 Tax=Chlamydomonas reinhardtii TaxID=3055 RepID=A0A2K3DRA8_CHLRE|nr:uncharacterized protein CHLRE_06g306035v5 [Chlamydomonas reinhardtii]XP_042924412.1 uncharacterized protein CHLRE_06g306035v5 [Chlamydomonas reinhardtii]PNW83084.1 hypothetical protein CHLRE_06g306035v5 [Chlamydomonas reinhardtii]PNW83085.1 hypothetical protein CHLRE_06g306035v5 [Chlamydomonas reinhardtii]
MQGMRQLAQRQQPSQRAGGRGGAGAHGDGLHGGRLQLPCRSGEPQTSSNARYWCQWWAGALAM